MSKVKINALPSSVIFTQGKREVTVGRNHLPLISGVISAVYTAKGGGMGAVGIARTKAFTSLAIPAGYKGRNNLLDCAKDSAQLAAGKRLIEKSGVIFKGSDEYRMIAEAIVDYVNKSKDFKKADAKVAKSGGKRVAKKSNKLKKFRVGDDGTLVRLSRGKPSPFWTIVQAPENAEGMVAGLANDIEGFKVIQQAGEKTEKVNKPRKSAKAKGISTEEVAAMVTSQVAEIVKDLPTGNVNIDQTQVLEMLTKMQNEIITVRQVCNLLKTKVDFQSNEIVKLSSKLDKLTATKPAKSSTSKKKTEDSRKAKEDAKLAAMADLSSISEEFANIVTKL